MLRRELGLGRPDALELIDAGVDGHVSVVMAESGLELLDPGEQSLLGRDGLVGNLLYELNAARISFSSALASAGSPVSLAV